MTSSNGNISALLAICVGNLPVPGEFPAQRPMMRSFGVFVDLRLNKRLRKQSWDWWFETLSHPLWRHCNAVMLMLVEVTTGNHVNILRRIRIGRFFADDIFKCILFYFQIKFYWNMPPCGLIDNKPTLVQIMVWCWKSGKPLSEPVIVSLTHISVTRA